MEIILNQTSLIKSLELVGKITTKNPTLPVLQCVKLTAKDGRIQVAATNLEINITQQIEGEVVEEGEVAIPTQVLLQSVQLISQKEITLRTEDQVVQLETKNTSTSIKTLATDEFPNIHKLEGKRIPLSAATFAYGVKSVAFAASVTSIKPELGSVFIQQKKEQTLTLVATDSFRLMEKTIPQKGLVLEQSFMIPAKNALELARVCEMVGEDPEMIVDDNQCALVFTDKVYVSSRLVNGNFPDYQQIIPKEYTAHTTVLKEDFQKSLKKTNIFLNKFRQVSFSLTDDSLTIASQNNETGHTTDTIRASTEGDELTLNFNQQYVTEPLQYIQDDSLQLHFAGIGRAMVLEGVADKTLRYLVMPMNK